MNFFVTVESNLTSLEVEKLGVGRLEQLLAGQLELHWNRDGQVRRVPRHVLQNALQEYRDTLSLKTTRRPQPVVIRWDQTEDLPDADVRSHIVPAVS